MTASTPAVSLRLRSIEHERVAPVPRAVGSWFEDFSQVGDDEVLRLLNELADDDTCCDVDEDGSRVPCRV